VPVTSQEDEWSSICELRVSIFPLSTTFLLDFETFRRVWYFWFFTLLCRFDLLLFVTRGRRSCDHIYGSWIYPCLFLLQYTTMVLKGTNNNYWIFLYCAKHQCILSMSMTVVVVIVWRRIYNYLCNQFLSTLNQCLSSLTLWVRTPFMARCTRYNIMWYRLSVTCVYSGFLHQ
jgi:hypothetical protein